MGHRRVRKQWRHLRAGVATSLGPRLPRYHAAMDTRIQHGRTDISQSRTLYELAGGPAREHPAHHNEGSSTGRTNMETAQQLISHQTPSDGDCPTKGVNGLTRQLGWRGRSDDDRDTGCRECYDATEEEAAGQVGQGCGARRGLNR